MIKSTPSVSVFLWLLGVALQFNSAIAWMNFPSSSSSSSLRQRRFPPATLLRANSEGINENNMEASDLKRRKLLAQSGVGLAALASTIGLNLVSLEEANASYGGYDQAETRRIDVFEKVAPSVVFIDTFTERRDVFTTNVMEVPLGTGSGFVWDQEGHIVTNFHVVREAKFAQVAILTKNAKGLSSSSSNNNNKPLPRLTSTLPQQVQQPAQAQVSQNPFAAPQATDVLPYTSMRPSGATSRSVYKARVVGVDPSKDIAVLKVDAPKSELFPISVGSSTGIKVGQQALAIGNPFGLDHTLTSGIVSGLGREVRSPIGRPISNVIQSDCAINPGTILPIVILPRKSVAKLW